MKFLINQMGSIEDIRCTLRHSRSKEDLQAALDNENANKQRTTVIKMLESALRQLDHRCVNKCDYPDCTREGCVHKIHFNRIINE